MSISDQAGASEIMWESIAELSAHLHLSPSLIATRELARRIAACEESSAVDAAALLQKRGLLDHRLFLTSLLKVDIFFFL